MAIGEILLSAFLQVLFEKLFSLGADYAPNKGAPSSGISIDLLNEWKTMLKTIEAVLNDAEDKQMRGQSLVKQWLDDVRDLAYDMEDLLDEFAIEAAQAKSQAEPGTSRDKVKWGIPFFGQSKSSVSNPSLLSRVSDEVEKINKRLEEINKRKADLSLTTKDVARSDYTDKRLTSSSLPEPRFFGREKEEEEILKLLTGEAKNGDTMLGIVPIVGMGGVGKTALAQRLYNDARVNTCFERKAWVCVSDIFDVLDITKTILRRITGLTSEGEDLNGLQVKLKDSLSGKKFLIVLDDIWNENYEKWTVLLKPFEAGAKGSKIIITTRNAAVVSTTRASPYPLKELSLDYCANLLAFHALGATNFKSHLEFEEIGNKIAEKCKGSPLAVKVLGGLLRAKQNPDEWRGILNNKTWDLSMGKNEEIIQVLKLSYLHLPSYLKRCFAYCAVLPKDYEFERNELVLLWIAEGLLDRQKTKENILELGWECFDELVSRSFLQQASVNTCKFSMHDLLNDLAKSIAGETYFNPGESQLVGNEDDASLEKARHASFISSKYVTSGCLRAYHRMKVLRSLMLLQIGYSEHKVYISNKVLNDLLTELKRLRVLSLCHLDITEVPKCVSDLKHLRYLNFSYTSIKSLPEWIVGLSKLQALVLRSCQELSTLPQGITKLVNLQFLDISDTPKLKEMPSGIGNLKNLIILSKFIVGLEKESQLKELKNLSHLQGELFLSELQRVEEVRDAVLVDKKGISNLILHWDEDCGYLPIDRHKLQVLNFLRPHANLESLTMSYYGGVMFPSWLDGGSYSKVVSLCLRGCRNVTSLPSLGQLPSLRELSLEGLDSVSMIGSEFYGNKRPFPSLTTLTFEEMLTWRDWSPYAKDLEEGVPFSCLQHLIVRSCHSLVGTLPCRLDHLKKLEIRSSLHLNISTDAVCFTSLHELHLEDCNKEILKSLAHLSTLTILKIQNLAELVCFDYGLMSCLVKLKELYIGGCDKLKYLWQDGNEILNLTCLQELSIKSCPQFTSFVVGGAIELPCNLERMELNDCMSLEKLPSKMLALKHLNIRSCPKLKGAVIPPDDYSGNNMMSQSGFQLGSFPCAEGRPTTLKTLEIGVCEGVESLEEIIVELLESLTIDGCEKLKSLPQCLHMLSHLTLLEISNCPALEIEVFPPLPITLSFLELKLCPKIKSLPNQWHHLTSLQHMCISNCPNIECFPSGGWPPNLRWLTIWGCENVKQPVREWGLASLTSLVLINIDGMSMGGEGEKVWFPSDADADAWTLLFPSSLIYLCIGDMRKVERLSSGLRNHLSSLHILMISNCPKLRDLPEDGLPPSLQQLYISGCKKIPKDRYLKLAEEIPLVEVDWVRIR